MILSVEPIGSLSEAYSPARYSPLSASVSDHARAEIPGPVSCARAQGAATHCKTSAAKSVAMCFDVLVTGP
jgi:hypothetical protein